MNIDVGQGSRAVLGRGMRHAAAVLWRNRMAMLSTSSTSTIPPHDLRFFQVNAFADKPFSGNPAAVFLVPPLGSKHKYAWSVDDKIMQQIAAEMKLSESAFLTPTDHAGCFHTSTSFLLRWFTPTKEVDLCGHATIASAAALALECGNGAECFYFDTRSGTLAATRHGTSEFELDFPSNPPTQSPNGAVAQTHHAIARQILGERMACAIKRLAYSAATKKLVVQMDVEAFGRADLEALPVPDVDRLLAIPQQDCPVTGVMVTVASEQPQYHFISRYFAPWNGIPEDPVTGAAHSVLAPFWLDYLRPQEKGGRGEGRAGALGERHTDGERDRDYGESLHLRARQCSPRGGDVTITSGGAGRLRIRGNAITLIHGTIRLPRSA